MLFLVFIAGGVLIMSPRTRQVIAAYVVVALATSVLIEPSAAQSQPRLALFAAMLLFKAAVAPIGILAFLRVNPGAADLRPSLSLPVRLLLVIAFAFVARAVAISPPFAAYAMGAVVPFLALCGAGMLIVDRSLLSHLIGLLVLGMAASVGGALLVPALPESIELGATFDALVVTFIGLALVRAFVEHNPLLDVESLRRLKG